MPRHSNVLANDVETLAAAVLEINRVPIVQASNDSVYEFVWGVAAGSDTIDDIAASPTPRDRRNDRGTLTGRTPWSATDQGAAHAPTLTAVGEAPVGRPGRGPSLPAGHMARGR